VAAERRRHERICIRMHRRDPWSVALDVPIEKGEMSNPEEELSLAAADIADRLSEFERAELRGLLAHAWPIGLALAVCVWMLALAVAPAAVGCPSLRHVKSFHGHATATFAAAASGKDPDSGGTETIGFGRAARKLHVKLPDKVHGSPHHRPFTLFAGQARGGSVTVDDSFDNTGTDIGGDATHNGPLRRNHGTASAVFAHKACKYRFQLGFQIPTTFHGDDEVDPGGVGDFAYSDAKHIPRDLTLHGDQKLPIRADPCTAIKKGAGCGGIDSSWYGDLVDLFECGSLNISGCQLHGNTEIGKASLSWHLKPKYK
jgi:hypothetical protein